MNNEAKKLNSSNGNSLQGMQVLRTRTNLPVHAIKNVIKLISRNPNAVCLIKL